MSAELDKQMRNLAALGITVKVNTHDGGEPSGPLGALKESAQRVGNYENEEN